MSRANYFFLLTNTDFRLLPFSVSRNICLGVLIGCVISSFLSSNEPASSTTVSWINSTPKTFPAPNYASVIIVEGISSPIHP